MSSSPRARAAGVPDVIRRITRVGQVVGGDRGEPGQRVLELEVPAVEGGGGGDARHGRRRARHRVAELGRSRWRVTMRSALIAWSTLLVADLDSEAPKTAIAETRARPTIRAEAVCAVRRGLRMEFSRPSLPGHAEQPGQRAADHARTAAARSPGPAWRPRGTGRPRRARPAGWPAGSARRPSSDRADQGQDRAPDEPAPQRGAGHRLPVVERDHRRDAHRARGPGRSRTPRSRRSRRPGRPARSAARRPAIPGAA